MMYPFESSEQELYEFEQLLKRHGLEIESGSDLEKVSLYIIEVNEKFKEEINHDNRQDIRPLFTEMVGLTEFIRTILRHQDHPDFNELLPHLKLLNSTSSVTQTTMSKVSDQANNKLFELYIALLCMDIGTRIRLDSPKNAKGDNPDILFEFMGTSWAIACKSMHSKSELTLFDRIEEGVEQIDRSLADKGIVIINFKNIIDYDLVWPLTNGEEYNNGEEPMFGSFGSVDIPFGILKKYGTEYQRKLADAKELSNLQHFRNSGKCPNAFVIFLQAVTSVIHNGMPIPAILKTLNLVEFDNDCHDYHNLVVQLNQAMHQRI